MENFFFLVGDAAHVMSPTGGMGGNTGIKVSLLFLNRVTDAN